jgi:hypothetical protein
MLKQTNLCYDWKFFLLLNTQGLLDTSNLKVFDTNIQGQRLYKINRITAAGNKKSSVTMINI